MRHTAVRYFLLFSLVSLLGAQGPNWTSPREYENVRVTFEYRLAQWAEAAVCLRTPAIGRPVQQGVSIFLAHDFHQKPGLYTTGALAGRLAPLRLLPPSFNVWHKVEIILDGPELEVRQDGELLQLTRLPAQHGGKGHIHFPDLAHKYEIRNFQAKDLGHPRAYVEQWAPFTKRGTSGEWQFGAEEFSGSNGHSIQYAAPLLEDFVFEAEVKATNRANGGIFFRGSAKEGEPRGFEVQIYSPLDSVFPTGSIYGLERSKVATDTEARWFHLRVLAQGATCTVWVDGIEVATTDRIQETRGQIGFQIHMENTTVSWRRVRAWRLDDYQP